MLVARHLATKPLWLDEAVSVSVASRPLPRLAAVLTHHDASAGLYYVLLHTWLRLGHGRAWDRVPSALCLVGSAALAAWIGGRWGTPWTGVACGALVATNPFLLFYGQEARPYALAVLLALASTAALFWRDGEPAPTTYVVATVALLYADLFAVLFVACQAGAVLVVHRRWRHNLRPTLVRSWALIALGTLPLALIIVLREGSQISWLPRPSPGALWQTFLSMAGGGPALAVMVGLVTLGALAALGVVVIPPGDRRPSGDTVAGSRLRLALPALAGSFAVPPVLLWTFAQVVPSFLSRYVICSTIGLIGLAVFGLEVGRRVAGVAAASTVLVGLVALGTAAAVGFEGHPYKYEDPPAVTAFIQSRTQAGDAIGFGSGGLRLVVDDYLASARPEPLDVALAPKGEAWRQHDLYAREVDGAQLTARLAGVTRLWLVTDPSDHRYPSFDAFAAVRGNVLGRFRPALAASFPGMDVTLYVRRS